MAETINETNEFVQTLLAQLAGQEVSVLGREYGENSDHTWVWITVGNLAVRVPLDALAPEAEVAVRGNTLRLDLREDVRVRVATLVPGTEIGA